MVDIIIKRIEAPTYTFHIKNRESFNIDLDTPVLQIAMPESGKEKADLLKIEGNTMQIPLSFLLNDYTGQVTSLVDEITGSESFSGDGVTKIFDLPFTNVNPEPLVTIDDIVKEPIDDYTIDIENKKITFTIAPPTGPDNIVVNNNVLTPMQQLIFLTDVWENRELTKSKYELRIKGSSFKKEGSITRALIEQSAETADKFRATINFIIGTNINSVENEEE